MSLVTKNSKQERFYELLKKTRGAYEHYMQTGQLDPHLFANEHENVYHRANSAFKALHGSSKRKEEEQIDMGYEDSLSNSARSEDMSKKQRLQPATNNNVQGDIGDGNEDDGGNPATETTLDPVKNVWHRFPNSQTARLKWVYTQMLGLTLNNANFQPSKYAYDQHLKGDAAVANTYDPALGSLEGGAPTNLSLKTPKLLKFRMTSPYSIVASDTGNLSEPQWIGYFDSMYQYYHVLQAQWKMSFTVAASGTTSTLNNGNYRFYVYWKYANYDDPPTQFTVDNTGKTTYEGTTLNLTPDDYDRMGGWNKVLVAQNNTHDVTREISGTYYHGDCGMDIKMVGTDPIHGGAASSEGWVASRVTAPFPENLCVILVQDHAVNVAASQGISIGIRSEINYLIQFKDLQSRYKYPTQSYTIGSASDVGQYFYRGPMQLNPVAATASAAVGTYN